MNRKSIEKSTVFLEFHITTLFDTTVAGSKMPIDLNHLVSKSLARLQGQQDRARRGKKIFLPPISTIYRYRDSLGVLLFHESDLPIQGKTRMRMKTSRMMIQTRQTRGQRQTRRKGRVDHLPRNQSPRDPNHQFHLQIQRRMMVCSSGYCIYRWNL